MDSAQPLKLNIGSGGVKIDGFTPVDILADGTDARKLPYADNAVDEIRASHILEHFGWKEVGPVLSEWVRVLRPGGRIRLAVPDVEAVIARKNDPLRLYYLMGGQKDEYDFHKSAFDEPALRQLMESVGIRNIRKWGSPNTDCASYPFSLNLEGEKGEVPTQQVAMRVAGVMSIPRVGWNDNWGCIVQSCAAFRIPIKRFSGAFWGQCMQRAFEEVVREAEADWILTIDYDTMLSPAHLQTILHWAASRPDIDAICGLQCRRNSDAALGFSAGKTEFIWTGEPLKVDTAHFGLTLIRTSKLAAMPKPWFWSKPTEDGGWDEGRIDDDIWFWNRWREAGNNVYVAPDCRIGHLELMVSEFVLDDSGPQPRFKAVQTRVNDWWNANGGKAKRW